MKQHQFVPFQGTESIRFGMSRESVRSIISSDFRVFLRNEFSENTTDYYTALNFFVEFDKDDICHAIEFGYYNYLIFDNRNLFDFKFNDLVEYFLPKSIKHENEEDVGITFFDLGFGATKGENDLLESIIIFSDKYW